MNRILIILIILSSNYLFSQKIRLDIKKEYSLGSNINAKKEYLLNWPDIIINDKYNNIYLLENKSLEIKKYDKNGRYIKNIGRAGEGPGEFKHIKSILINEKDQLIVIDQILSRLTIFSLDGKYVTSHNLSTKIVELSKISQYNAENFIGLQIISRDYGVHGNKIVVIDDQLKNTITSFGHTSIFWHFDNSFEKIMDRSNMLRTLTINSGKVAITKEVYDGKLYLFDNKDNWKAKIIKGSNEIPNKQYEIYDKLLKSTDKELKSACKAMITSIKNGDKNQIYTFVIMSRSLGLFNYKNKYIINLIAFAENNSTTLGAELYNLDGSYIGFNKIGKDIIQYTDTYIEVLCKDNDSSFYISTMSQEKLPILTKYKIYIE